MIDKLRIGLLKVWNVSKHLKTSRRGGLGPLVLTVGTTLEALSDIHQELARDMPGAWIEHVWLRHALRLPSDVTLPSYLAPLVIQRDILSGVRAISHTSQVKHGYDLIIYSGPALSVAERARLTACLLEGLPTTALVELPAASWRVPEVWKDVGWLVLAGATILGAIAFDVLR